MAKIVDITDKLDFDAKPRLVIKGTELEVNDDAPTVLKVMGLMSDGDPGLREIEEAYELIFPEESRSKINSIGLKFSAFMTLIREAINLITGDEEGNGETHTTT